MQASAMGYWDQVAPSNLFQTNSVDESYCYILEFLITISTRKHMEILTFLVVMITENQYIYK